LCRRGARGRNRPRSRISRITQDTFLAPLSSGRKSVACRPCRRERADVASSGALGERIRPARSRRGHPADQPPRRRDRRGARAQSLAQVDGPRHAHSFFVLFVPIVAYSLGCLEESLATKGTKNTKEEGKRRDVPGMQMKRRGSLMRLSPRDKWPRSP